MKIVELQSGQLFVAPLLGGGFAYGCVTRPHDKKFPSTLVAVYDIWTETPDEVVEAWVQRESKRR